MLNKLTKCCGILAMFALYFLSAPGAFAQCESIDEYTLIVGGSGYATEVGWRVEAPDGSVVAQAGGQVGEQFTTCSEGSGQGTFTFDLASGTQYTFVFIDCFGDGWNGGTAIMYRTADTGFVMGSIGAGVGFTSGQGSPSGGQLNYAFTTLPAEGCGCTDESSCNYDPDATTDDGSCAIPGCMDATACNYDSCANEDDGSCATESVVWTISGTYMPEVSWELADADGNVIASGGGYPYSFPYPTVSETICVNAACYSFTAIDSWGDGWDGPYSLSTNGVAFYNGSGAFGTSETVDFCFAPGCTDPNASNYSSLSTEDDGSCQYLGCTDPNDFAYDSFATEDDGSCLGCDQSGNFCYGNYGNTQQIVLQTGVPSGNDGLYFLISSGLIENNYDQIYIYDGLEINADNLLFFAGDSGFGALDISGTFVFAPSGTITVAIDSDTSVSCASSATYAGGISWQVACNVGCMDTMACNYDENAGIDDGTCDYSCVGCMDTSAANFDPNATMQGEGSCVFCDPGTFVFNIEMTDSGNDGWEGAAYFLTDLATDEMIQGTYDEAGLQLGDLAVDFVCMPLGCYTFSAGGGAAVGEIGVTLSDQFGTTYFEGSGAISTTNIDFGLTQLCAFEGCTDPYCWNYDISATIDDGSCICPPLNNAVEDAIALECGSVVNGTVANASDVEGIVGTLFGGHTINQGGAWYQYNASGTQQVFIDLCGTPNAGFAAGTELNDSQIHVFVEDANGDLVPVASNDESCFSHAGVSIVTDVAETYYIHVSAFGAGDGGQFQISVNCTEACTTGTPFNDDCAGALPQLNGIAFSGSTCCTNQEGAWSAGNVDYGAGVLSGASTYGVWFTFNSGDFDSFDFDLQNGDGAAVSLSIYYAATNCDEVSTSTVFAGGGIAGCNVTGQCAGSISAITDLIPNTDYYFLVGTTDPGECGTFSFSTTGVYLGCMDTAATNYDAQATEDDGSCDYTDVVPDNDLCNNAITLPCNGGYEVYSMGGATEDDFPVCGGGDMDFEGCLTATYGLYPSATFTPSCTGTFQNITTCAYAGEYSNVNLTAGNTYTFVSSNPDYMITVANSTGTTVYAAGMGGEVEYVATATETVRVYRNTAGCGSATGCTTFAVSCGGTPPGGVWFTFEGTGELHNINTCGSILDTQLQLFTAPSATSCDMLECTTQIDGSPAVSQTSFEDCGFFDQDDASLNFVSEPGVTYFVYVGTDLSNNGSYQIEMTCEEAIYGCVIDIACNYNPLANLEDECDFTSCACSDETQTAVVIEMFDTFGDGWSGGNDGSMGGYEIQDMDGNVYASGTLEEALYQVDEDNYQGAEYGIDTQCLSDGCYFLVFTTADIWSEEQAWALTVNGTVVAEAGYTAADNSTTFEYAFTIGDFECGCTDDFACNFDGVAPDWMENGTCEYVTCAGCTDPDNCFYDGPEFTIDDGSCCTENCITIQMFDSFGDGWNGNVLTIADLDGNVIQTAGFSAGSSAVAVGCLPDGCYTVSCGGGSFASEVSWDLLGVYGGTLSGVVQGPTYFSVGGNNCIEGCSILCACNYDAAVNIPTDDVCEFYGCGGCTYPGATNYDETAASDDGSCEFDFANPCPADLNEDGSVSTADLLQFLGAFGTVCE